MVCDEKLLRKNPDVFKLLMDRHWSVVVPHSGMCSRVKASIKL
jgi:hypothetical protein